MRYRHTDLIAYATQLLRAAGLDEDKAHTVADILVEGDLMWAFDMAAMGEPLQPHLSARLSRTEPAG